MTADFFVPGTPQPKGSAKAFYNKKMNRAIVVQDNREKQKPWASIVSVMAQQNCRNINGPVSLYLFFIMPRPKSHYGTGRNAQTVKDSAPLRHVSKPDLDKLTRCVKDALTGIAYGDDSQVCELKAGKAYGPSPGVRIRVQALEEPT